MNFSFNLRACLRVRLTAPLYLMLFSFTAYSASSEQKLTFPLTLIQALEKTLKYNPQLHQFEMKEQALQGQLKSAKLQPALNVELSVENGFGTGNVSGIKALETTLALSSVIELGGKRSARVSVANEQLQLLNLKQKVLSLDVLAELAKTFIAGLEVQALIKLNKEESSLAKQALAIVANKVKQGAAGDAELKRAEAAVASTGLKLKDLKYSLQRNMMALSAFWGSTSITHQVLTGDLFKYQSQPNYSELYDKLLGTPSIEVFASEDRLKKAQYQLAKSHASADLSWQFGVRRFEEIDDTAFTAGFSIPLFTNQRQKGALMSALAERNEVVYRRKNALLSINKQLFNAFSQRTQHLEAVDVFNKQIIPQLTQALIATQQAYQAGRYRYQDWVAAQQELLSAKQNLIKSAAAAALNQTIIEQLIAQPLNH